MSIKSEELTAMVKDIRHMISKKKDICEQLGIRDIITLEDIEICIVKAIKEQLFNEWQEATEGGNQ